MSSFSSPLRVYGDNREGASADIGEVTAMQEANIAFGNTAVTNAFILPPNAVPIEFYVDTTTLFDQITTIDVGITGTGNRFADDATITTVGRVLGTADVSQVPNYVDVGTSAVQVTFQLTTTATAGAGKLRCLYWINKTLPA